MNRPFSHISLIVFVLTLGGQVCGQTKIAVPTTTVQFSDLKTPKKQRIATKKLSRLRKKQVRDLDKLVKRNTSLSKHELSTYHIVFQSMDSIELRELTNEVNDISQAKRIQKYKKIDRNIIGASDYSLDLIKSDPKFDLLTPDQKDSLLREYKNQELAKYANEVPFAADSISQFNIQSSMDSTIETRIKQRLESLVQEKISAESYEDLASPIEEPQTQMQHYVSSLETFNYKKPEIPRDKLSKALFEQYKERGKQELLNNLKLNTAENQQKDSSPLARFAIGGYARYDANRKSIELTPVLTYSPHTKLNFGLGYQTYIPLTKDDSLKTRGVRVFSQYTFYKNYYLHGESEWSRQIIKGETNSEIKERSTYVGIGRNFKYKFITSSITALYNFNAPSEIHQKKFTLRVGITISK